jgi:DNA-binding NtrC family response regulator
MIPATETIYPSFKVLLVDDEPAWLRSLSLSLERTAGINNVLACDDSTQVMDILSREQVGLILLDLTMPGFSGEQLLDAITEQYPHIQVIIISGMNQLETAVRCIKQGAFDYFVKTDAQEHMTKGVLRAIRTQELYSVNSGMRKRILTGELQNPEAFADIVTVSPCMLAVFKYIESVAPSTQPVLVTGESGSGKELVAQAIHTLSERKGPLVSVNVAGLDDTSFADTLFGHTRGAFTGAGTTRPGMIEQARGGSLFLDEIGDLSLQSQVKLLRVLQENEFYPLGSDRPKLMQARVIVATHQDLQQKVQDGTFRKDLYYRLCTHHVDVPPLRKRPKDIPALLDRFLEEAAEEFGKKKPAIPKELPLHLANYSFPGNIRELRGMVYDAVSTHKAKVLSMHSFLRAMERENTPAPDAQTVADSSRPFAGLEHLPTITECTAMLIEEAVERADGNQTLAARMLGISQPALSKRLKQLRS